MNPELLRNLRLEFSLPRLIAMPVILAVVFALVWFMEMGEAAERLYIGALVVLYVIVLLWGVRKSAGSLAGELANNTWDAQRLSAMSAGELLLGKLVGAASYPLYGAAICLCTAFVATFAFDGASSRQALLIHLMISALALAFAFLVAAVLMTRRMGRTGVSVTLCQIITLLLILYLPFVSPLFVSEEMGREAQTAFEQGSPLLWLSSLFGGNATWYGVEISAFIFRLLTLSSLLFWAILGAIHILRVELQYRSIGWSLAAFMLFCMVYFGGLVYLDFAWITHLADAPSIIRKFYPVTLQGFMVALVLAYLVMFLAPKSENELQRFLAAIGSRDPRGAAVDAPPWLVAVAVVFLAFLAHVVLVAVSPPAQSVLNLDELLGNFDYISNTPLDLVVQVVSAVVSNQSAWTLPLGLFGFCGLLLRDLALLLLLNLGRNSGRADLTALVYLMVLYLVLPGLLYALNSPSSVAYLLPSVRIGAFDAIAVHWLQAMLVTGLFVWRWRQIRAVPHAPIATA